MLKLDFNTKCPESYQQFLKVRSLPQYKISGSRAYIPDEYAALLGIAPERTKDKKYIPSDFLFDYQGDISRLAIKKRKFAIYGDCGLGKWLMICEYVRHAVEVTGKRALIVMPLLCIQQQLDEKSDFMAMDCQWNTSYQGMWENGWLNRARGLV